MLKVKVTFLCVFVSMILRLPADSTQPWARLGDLVVIIIVFTIVISSLSRSRYHQHLLR